jgi:phosphatidylethanolamine/phosphatidyl-N-methylethanolamine N-methyltransferase
VLEVGAGVGPVTLELAARLSAGDELDVVELNTELFEFLTQRLAQAPPSAGTVRLHNADILKFEAPHRYDHIVSGLPLANFPAELVEAMYGRFFDLLEDAGTLIMFQHIFGREIVRLFADADNRTRAQRVMDIEARLADLVVAEQNVVLNVPPARVVVRKRPPDHSSSTSR